MMLLFQVLQSHQEYFPPFEKLLYCSFGVVFVNCLLEELIDCQVLWGECVVFDVAAETQTDIPEMEEDLDQ